MHKLLNKISTYTFVSIVTGSFSLLLLPLLTSYLSTADYGLLSLYNASIRFFLAFITLGMSHVLLVELIKNKQRFSLYLSGYIQTTFRTAIGLVLLLVLVSLFLDDFFGLPTKYAIFLPLVALLVVYYELFIAILVYLKKARHYVFFTLGKFTIEITGILVFIVLLNSDWRGRIIALIIALITIVALAYNYLIKNKLLNLSKKSTSSKHKKDLSKKGLPLVFMTFAIMIIDLSDRFFIEHFSSIEATGIYGVAATLSGLILIVISILINTIRPTLYEYLTHKTEMLKQIVKLGFIYHAILLSAVILLMVCMPYLIDWFLDVKFHNALSFTYFLIPGLLFWGSYQFFLSFMLFKNRNIANGVVAVIGIIINLVLNYILIQKHGSIGAAESTLYTYFIMFFSILLFVMVRKKNRN